MQNFLCIVRVAPADGLARQGPGWRAVTHARVDPRKVGELRHETPAAPR